MLGENLQIQQRNRVRVGFLHPSSPVSPASLLFYWASQIGELVYKNPFPGSLMVKSSKMWRPRLLIALLPMVVLTTVFGLHHNVVEPREAPQPPHVDEEREESPLSRVKRCGYHHYVCVHVRRMLLSCLTSCSFGTVQRHPIREQPVQLHRERRLQAGDLLHTLRVPELWGLLWGIMRLRLWSVLHL